MDAQQRLAIINSFFAAQMTKAQYFYICIYFHWWNVISSTTIWLNLLDIANKQNSQKLNWVPYSYPKRNPLQLPNSRTQFSVCLTPFSIIGPGVQWELYIKCEWSIRLSRLTDTLSLHCDKGQGNMVPYQDQFLF